jgi:hypothetical protein
MKFGLVCTIGVLSKPVVGHFMGRDPKERWQWGVAGRGRCDPGIAEPPVGVIPRVGCPGGTAGVRHRVTGLGGDCGSGVSRECSGGGGRL